jgi:alkanesulfonate monooxygenase SsuD/methylene tetrahydromethanopterin reductase-like flavin-dependent oxidoreductase (luciferase family)
MELGVISLSDIQTDPVTGRRFPYQQRVEEIVGYATLADRTGLDVFALGEHHTLDFAVSSPAVVLAAAAARTSRIRLTSGVTVLPVLDPVRVYQDFATLDLISHGRAEVIAGRSAFVEPFLLFGEDINNLDELFGEKLDLLLKLRNEDPITWSGKVRPPLRAAEVNPRATGELPVWVAVGGTPSSAERAGRLGLPMMLGLIGGTIDHAKRLIAVYRAAGEHAGHPAESLQVGITSHFYVGENDEKAVADYYPYYESYLSPRNNRGRGWDVDQRSMAMMAARRGALMVGGPQLIAEKILDLSSELGAVRFLGQVDAGGMPKEMVRDSILRFGDVVAPAVRHVLAR